MKLLEPGSGINHGMWAFLNIIFVIIAFLILIMYIADVGGIHTLVFGFLLLGLAASANWCVRVLVCKRRVVIGVSKCCLAPPFLRLMYELLCARKDQAAAEKKDS